MITSRRRFLASSLALGASPLIVRAQNLGLGQSIAPNNRIGLAYIGCGRKTDQTHLRAFGNEVQKLMVCDVDASRLKAAKRKVGGDVTSTPYFEEVLANDAVDAVLIGTPDHWHAGIAIAAMRAGKDVYVEKPMTLTVEEGKAMREAERRYGRIVQVGAQQRSDEGFRKAAEIVRNGLIGELREVHTKIGRFPPPLLQKPEPIPEGFDYDRWLGPTPHEDYFKERVKGDYGGGWRRFWEYGTRKLGDWGAHHFDIVQWAMDMDDSGPVEFIPAANDEEGSVFVYANGVRVYVNSGDQKGSMIRFVGTEGEAMAHRRTPSLVTTPSYLAKQPLPSSAERLYFSNDHHQNWIDSIRSRKTPISPTTVGHRSGSICQVMAIAERLGRPLRWDPELETIVGDPMANRWLSRPRRAGYELPV